MNTVNKLLFSEVSDQNPLDSVDMHGLEITHMNPVLDCFFVRWGFMNRCRTTNVKCHSGSFIILKFWHKIYLMFVQ